MKFEDELKDKIYAIVMLVVVGILLVVGIIGVIVVKKEVNQMKVDETEKVDYNQIEKVLEDIKELDFENMNSTPITSD